jgi:hypothetical protein
MRFEFGEWLGKQDRKFTPRIMAHMKRDVLIRALFSPEPQVTIHMMERSITWAKRQLELRQLIWPEDAATPSEGMERRILEVLKKNLARVLEHHAEKDDLSARIEAGLTDRELFASGQDHTEQ